MTICISTELKQQTTAALCSPNTDISTMIYCVSSSLMSSVTSCDAMSAIYDIHNYVIGL